MTDSNTTILLNVYEKLGSVETKLQTIMDRQEKIEAKIAVLDDLKSRLGAYVWIAGSVVVGVISLLWYGVSFFSTEIKSRFFH